MNQCLAVAIVAGHSFVNELKGCRKVAEEVLLVMCPGQGSEFDSTTNNPGLVDLCRVGHRSQLGFLCNLDSDIQDKRDAQASQCPDIRSVVLSSQIEIWENTDRF